MCLGNNSEQWETTCISVLKNHVVLPSKQSHCHHFLILPLDPLKSWNHQTIHKQPSLHKPVSSPHTPSRLINKQTMCHFRNSYYPCCGDQDTDLIEECNDPQLDCEEYEERDMSEWCTHCSTVFGEKMVQLEDEGKEEGETGSSSEEEGNSDSSMEESSEEEGDSESSGEEVEEESSDEEEDEAGQEVQDLRV